VWCTPGDFQPDARSSAISLTAWLRLPQQQTKQKTGRPGKLSLEDQLLMTLEYWREYRTYFHIGQSWRVNESTAYRIIRKIEDTLTKSRTFTLPGKKRLTNSDYQLQVVIIDVTESPIERPKKNKKSSTVGKKNSIH
jgi:hypothetical protein